MRYAQLKKRFIPLAAFCSLFLFAFTPSATAGLDSFEIYLNNRLLVRQTVDKPLSLENLQLDKSNVNDRLVIRYSQCTAPNKIGKGRKIVIKDANGAVVKEWKFADTDDMGMSIPVKELLELEKKNGKAPLNLVYTAEGHTNQKLTSLMIGPKGMS